MIVSPYVYPGVPGMKGIFGNPVSPKVIVEAVCNHFEITEWQIRYGGRKKAFVEARHVAVYLMKKKTRMSQNKISAYFGGKDHTIAIHGFKKIQGFIETYPEYKKEIENLMDSI